MRSIINEPAVIIIPVRRNGALTDIASAIYAPSVGANNRQIPVTTEIKATDFATDFLDTSSMTKASKEA